MVRYFSDHICTLPFITKKKALKIRHGTILLWASLYIAPNSQLAAVTMNTGDQTRCVSFYGEITFIPSFVVLHQNYFNFIMTTFCSGLLIKINTLRFNFKLYREEWMYLIVESTQFSPMDKFIKVWEMMLSSSSRWKSVLNPEQDLRIWFLKFKGWFMTTGSSLCACVICLTQ